MALCAALFTYFFSGQLAYVLHNTLNSFPILENMVDPLAIFLPFAIIIGLYFRVVFGFFSRLFERQADLHVFELGLDPKSLIAAFNFIGEATGQSLAKPCWHHYSLQQRINFLEEAQRKPSLILKHHRYVKKMLFLYFTFLIIITLGLVYLDII